MKHLFNKNEIAIDLTSLLDVIFIVLLIVMCSQKTLTTDAKNQLEQAEQATQEANELKANYENHIEKYEQTDEYVLFIDVTAIYDVSHIEQRTIQVMAGADVAQLTPYAIAIDAQSEQDGYADLSAYISSQITAYMGESDADRPVFLTVNKNDDDILYRDEQAIEHIFERLQQEYPSIYIR